ncbi:MAG: alpha/beta fold hydrolase, partial [Devosia sp.]
ARERVIKLALIDTSSRPDTEDSTAIRRRRIALAKGGKFGAVIEQSFPNSVHPDNQGSSDLYSIHRAMAEANGAEAYMRQQEAIIARPDSRGELGAISVPTLVLVGESDQITPPEVARETADGISGSRLVIVPRAGHLALLEQPMAVNRALTEWAAI